MIHKRLEKLIPVHQVLLHPLQLFLVKPVELRKLLERDLHEWPAKCLCCCNGNGYRRTEGNNLAPTVRFKADERAGTLTLIALDGIAFLEIALQRVDELAGLEANFRRRAVQLWALAAAPASGSGNNDVLIFRTVVCHEDRQQLWRLLREPKPKHAACDVAFLPEWIPLLLS